MSDTINSQSKLLLIYPSKTEESYRRYQDKRKEKTLLLTVFHCFPSFSHRVRPGKFLSSPRFLGWTALANEAVRPQWWKHVGFFSKFLLESYQQIFLLVRYGFVFLWWC